MNHVPFKAAALGAAVLFALAGCGGGGGGGGGSGETGTLDMSITDAPIDGAEAVFVTFTGIELRRNGEKIVIEFDEPVGVDLLTLQGNNSEFLIQGQELPAGVYDEVRLRVAGEGNASCNAPSPPYDSYIVLAGETEQRPLFVPSGPSSGFKVKGGITIAAGQRADYTVDFDVRKSIAERKSGACYNMRPVMRVVDNAETGTLVGTVDDALLADASCAGVAGADTSTGAGSAVYVYEGEVTPDDFDGLADPLAPDPLVTALLTKDEVSGDFTYEVGFLLTGTYTVAFTCQAGNDVPPAEVPPVEPEEVESDNVLLFVDPQTATITTDATTVVNFEAAPPPPEEE
jgi:hypothetical protein